MAPAHCTNPISMTSLPDALTHFNGRRYVSKNGLLDLLNENMTEEPLYPPIHLSGDDIEVAIAHGTGYGESYFSFVNGQYTSQGGTHQAAFREAIARQKKEVDYATGL